jgi:hypothetical protein
MKRAQAKMMRSARAKSVLATSRHDACSVPASAAALSAKAQIVKEAKAKALKRRKL